jgi:hypothetical protein
MPKKLTAKEQALSAGLGAVAGVATGLTKTLASTKFPPVGVGLAAPASKFFHSAVRAMKSHKGLVGALGAGATAVVGPTVAGAAVAAAPVVIAAAPFVLGAAAVGGAIWGIRKVFSDD